LTKLSPKFGTTVFLGHSVYVSRHLRAVSLSVCLSVHQSRPNENADPYLNQTHPRTVISTLTRSSTGADKPARRV